MKYIIYLRVSTDEQDEKTQLFFCLRFIKQKDPTDFKYLVFKDKITSRKPLFEREGGKAMLQALNKGDVIIAMRLDRIARKLHETTQLINELDKKGAEIFLVEQPGIQNKIMLGLYAGMAEEEVKLLRKRVSEKLESKKNQNERYSRFLPYGYDLHKTHLVAVKVGKEIVMKPGILIPLDSEQQVINKMCEYFDEGLSYNHIAKLLTEDGHMNRLGKPFGMKTVYRILERHGRSRKQDDERFDDSEHDLIHATG